MPGQVRLWKITDHGEKLLEISPKELILEEHLETWLESDISIISDDLLVIGRQVESIDLLAVDSEGRLV